MGQAERVQGKHQVPRFPGKCVSAVYRIPREVCVCHVSGFPGRHVSAMLHSSQGSVCLLCYRVPTEVCVCRVTGFPGRHVSVVLREPGWNKCKKDRSRVGLNYRSRRTPASTHDDIVLTHFLLPCKVPETGCLTGKGGLFSSQIWKLKV